jgi:ABC-type sugar transport system substrate-binding protein
MSGAIKTVLTNGDTYVQMTDDYSIQQEEQNVSAAIAEHVAMIFLWTGYPQAAQEEVHAAKAAGIPLFLFWAADSGVTNDILGGAYYDFTGSGTMVGNWVVKNVANARVMELTGSLGSGTTEAIEKGFADALAGSSAKITVNQNAQWSADKAASLTSSLMPANPGVNVIFTYNDEMALAVERVLSSLGLASKVKVVTESVSSTAGIAAVKSGTIPLAAYDPLADYGSQAMADALNLLKGKSGDKALEFGPSHITSSGTHTYCYQQYTK